MSRGRCAAPESARWTCSSMPYGGRRTPTPGASASSSGSYGSWQRLQSRGGDGRPFFRWTIISPRRVPDRRRLASSVYSAPRTRLIRIEFERLATASRPRSGCSRSRICPLASLTRTTVQSWSSRLAIPWLSCTPPSTSSHGDVVVELLHRHRRETAPARRPKRRRPCRAAGGDGRPARRGSTRGATAGWPPPVADADRRLAHPRGGELPVVPGVQGRRVEHQDRDLCRRAASSRSAARTRPRGREGVM